MLVSDYKYIHDNIHGYIPISNYAQHIINSPIFQRLKKIKQLGTCVYAFPNAVHTRFEHSIGSYHLAGLILNRIVKNTKEEDIIEYVKNIPELSNYYEREYSNIIYPLDDYVCELIKISALCHDLGHGPFSHVFDDHFIPSIKKNSHIHDTHEERSKILIEKIIKNDMLLKNIITESEIQFIKNIISPSEQHIGFIYQIVSNSLNGLDIDKFDYLARDSYILGIGTNFDSSGLINHIKIIENNISYPERVLYEIKKLYDTRYSLHKQVYTHKTVIACQLMIIDLFIILDPVLNLAESVQDMDKFCKLTDEYIFNCVDHRLDIYKKMSYYDDKYNLLIRHLNSASLIIDKLNNHDIYKFVGYSVSNVKINIEAKDFIDHTLYNEKYDDRIIIFQTKIGYVSGNKNNPLKNIFTHSSTLFCSNISSSQQQYTNPTNIISISDICLITPILFQEYITMIYFKNTPNDDVHDVDIIKNMSESILNYKKMSHSLDL